MIASRALLLLPLLLPVAGCGGDKYAGPDWMLSGDWVPVNADPTSPPYGNTLPPVAAAATPVPLPPSGIVR